MGRVGGVDCSGRVVGDRGAADPAVEGAAAGRRDTPDEPLFAAITYVLVSGCACRASPPCFGMSKSTAHRQFLIRSRAGVRGRLHRADYGLTDGPPQTQPPLTNAIPATTWSFSDSPPPLLLRTTLPTHHRRGTATAGSRRSLITDASDGAVPPLLGVSASSVTTRKVTYRHRSSVNAHLQIVWSRVIAMEGDRSCHGRNRERRVEPSEARIRSFFTPHACAASVRWRFATRVYSTSSRHRYRGGDSRPSKSVCRDLSSRAPDRVEADSQ